MLMLAIRQKLNLSLGRMQVREREQERGQGREQEQERGPELRQQQKKLGEKEVEEG
jgi:hypothetical protein